MPPMEELLGRVRVVLAEPLDSRNIGSVCRAMKTMGITSLYITGGAPVQREVAAITAVHAADVLDRAVLCPSLSEAIRDASLVAGVTRRRGRRRKYFALSPEELAEKAASTPGVCALVFGNESSGLNDRDLSLCHAAVRIPSSPQFPSLNLSHAVQILCYQLFVRACGAAPRRGEAVSHGRLEDLVERIVSALAEIGFFSQGEPGDQRLLWREILGRAGLAEAEAKRLETVFQKIRGLHRKTRS